MMRQDSLIRWLKSMLCTAVIAIWVTGLSILGVACWVRDNLNSIIIVAEGTTIGNFYIYSFFPIFFPVLISVSCLMLVIGCVGFCGACSENKILLGWFFLAILVSLCVEISTGVGTKWDWSANTYDEDMEYINEKMKKSDWQNTVLKNQAWEEVQLKFNCCVMSSTDEKVKESDFQAVSSYCFESMEDVKRSCGEALINFLQDTKALKALPFLATILGMFQFAALIITAKLWMIACVTERQEGSNEIQNKTPGRYSSATKEFQLNPMLKNKSVQTTQSSHETLLTKLPTYITPNEEFTYNECCPRCAMKWYEETKFTTLSRLEAEYRQLQVQNNRRNRRISSHHSEELLPQQRSTPSVIRSTTAPAYQSHDLVKSASYTSPTDWQSPSLQSVIKGARDCYSASLPRRKHSYNRRHRRINYSRNFIQRLSTIRASGVAVESDTSSDFDESTQEELGGSRCYNTEAGSSSSGDKQPFVRYGRDRKTSEPAAADRYELVRANPCDYTTL